MKKAELISAFSNKSFNILDSNAQLVSTYTLQVYGTSNTAIQYTSCYKARKTASGNERSVFTLLNPAKGKYGIYAFIDTGSDQVYYIGEADTQYLFDRLKNHFQDIKGSVRRKAQKIGYDLNNSEIIFFDLQTTTNLNRVKYDEAFLISVFEPVLNN